MKKLTKKQVKNELDEVYPIIDYDSFRMDRSILKTEAQKILYEIMTDPEYFGMNKAQRYNEVYRRLGISNRDNKEFIKVSDSGVVIRNLPANDKYIIVSYGCFDEGGWYCQNCGRYIRYWFEVENTKKERFLIGSECIHTVVQYDNTERWEIFQRIKELNRLKKYKKQIDKIIKDGGRLEYNSDDDRYILYNRYDRFVTSMSKKFYESIYRKGV